MSGQNTVQRYDILLFQLNKTLITPDEGTVIALYGVLWGDTYTNFTVTLDEQATEVPPRSLPPANSSAAVYNFTVYSVQSLPYRFHQLVMTLTNWTSDRRSLLLLDYVHINDTIPPPPAQNTTSASPTPKHSPARNST
jgi:hypothetical protein